MPSAKERQAKRMAKLRTDPDEYKLFLEKRRNRRKELRSKAKCQMSDSEWDEHKLKERVRIREYRAKPKTSSPQSIPYRSRQSLGKAVRRVKKSLPLSPTKQWAVVHAVAQQVGVTTEKPSCSTTSSSPSLSSDTLSAVTAFYDSNDISWQAPGIKDRVILRETNGAGVKSKTTVQARYMMMSLREAYKKYLDSCPGVQKFGLSKFCSVRPKHVKLFEQLPHQVCLCTYHENVRLLLEALKPHTGLHTEFAGFIEQVTCDGTSKQCLLRECQSCVGKFSQFSPQQQSVIVEYRQWQATAVRVEKVALTGTTEEVFGKLEAQLPQFLLHTYIKRAQFSAFSSLKSKCDGKNIVLQVDFSENASITFQREVQAAHWHYQQATLFTAHAWVDGAENLSVVIVSDDLAHTKHSIYVYIQRVLKSLCTKFSSIESVEVFSDGPTTQFKQRFLFSNLHSWEQEYGINITWNFFATSHGKGAVDGIGGTVKRAVLRNILAEKTHVTTPEEYALLADKLCEKIEIQYVSKEEIDMSKQFLDCKWKNVLAVPGTHKIHCVKAKSSDFVLVAETSDSTTFRQCSIMKQAPPAVTVYTPPVEIRPVVHVPQSPVAAYTPSVETSPDVPPSPQLYSVGEWVIVSYDSEEYRGEITALEENDIQVNVMHKSGNGWKWPSIPDNIFYPKNNIIQSLKPPFAASSRGQFLFEE